MASGPDVAERPDFHAVLQRGAGHDRRDDSASRAERRIRDRGVGTDLAVGAHDGSAAEVGVGMDHGVLAYSDAGVNVHGGRLAHGNAGEHPFLSDRAPHRLFGFGELHPGVHADGFPGRVGGHVGDDLALLGGGAQQIAPRRPADGVQVAPEPLRAEPVDARVDFVCSAVAIVLDGVGDAARGVPDDPRQPVRRPRRRREKRNGRTAALVDLGHRGQRLGRDQRDVAVEHGDVVDALQAVSRPQQRAAAVQRTGLFHVGDRAAQGRSDGLGVRRYDDYGGAYVRAGRGLRDERDHRLAADRVEYLGHGGLHPSARVGSEDNHRSGCHCLFDNARTPSTKMLHSTAPGVPNPFTLLKKRPLLAAIVLPVPAECQAHVLAPRSRRCRPSGVVLL